MGTHKDAAARVAAEAGDAEILEVSRQSPQVLPRDVSCLPWQRQDETLGTGNKWRGQKPVHLIRRASLTRIG